MITAERLEELIKKGATIYHINGKSIKLHLKDGNIMPVWVCDLNELFETQEQAEWALKTTAEHTERFEPPMWEDIKGYYCFAFILDNCPRFFVVKKDNWITIDDIGCKNIFEKYASDVTKENYIKACEIVRDLFNKGGAK